MKDKYWTKALCKEVGTEVFFPQKGENRLINQAKSICKKCSLKVECLEYALQDIDTKGIWGGTTEFERLKMLGRRIA